MFLTSASLPLFDMHPQVSCMACSPGASTPTARPSSWQSPIAPPCQGPRPPACSANPLEQSSAACWHVCACKAAIRRGKRQAAERSAQGICCCWPAGQLNNKPCFWGNKLAIRQAAKESYNRSGKDYKLLQCLLICFSTASPGWPLQ